MYDYLQRLCVALFIPGYASSATEPFFGLGLLGAIRGDDGGTEADSCEWLWLLRPGDAVSVEDMCGLVLRLLGLSCMTMSPASTWSEWLDACAELLLLAWKRRTRRA